MSESYNNGVHDGKKDTHLKCLVQLPLNHMRLGSYSSH